MSGYEGDALLVLLIGVFVQLTRAVGVLGQLVPPLRTASVEPARNGRKLDAVLKHFSIASPAESNSPTKV